MQLTTEEIEDILGFEYFQPKTINYEITTRFDMNLKRLIMHLLYKQDETYLQRL